VAPESISGHGRSCSPFECGIVIDIIFREIRRTGKGPMHDQRVGDNKIEPTHRIDQNAGPEAFSRHGRHAWKPGSPISGPPVRSCSRTRWHRRTIAASLLQPVFATRRSAGVDLRLRLIDLAVTSRRQHEFRAGCVRLSASRHRGRAYAPPFSRHNSEYSVHRPERVRKKVSRMEGTTIDGLM